MSGEDVQELLQGVLRQFQAGAAGPAATVTGAAGGGAVRITLEGLERVTSVTLAPGALEDLPLLEELVASAMNDALAQARDTRRQAASGLLQGLGLQAEEAP